jgi:hypothetical protein
LAVIDVHCAASFMLAERQIAAWKGKGKSFARRTKLPTYNLDNTQVLAVGKAEDALPSRKNGLSI